MAPPAFACLQSIKTRYLYGSRWSVWNNRKGGRAQTGAHARAGWPFNGHRWLVLISRLSGKMSGVCSSKRPEEVLYQVGVHCLKEAVLISLSLLFSSEMTPDLLVNKAVTEELMAGLFLGDQPSGSCSAQATLKLSGSKSPFEDFALFPPSLCLFSA